LLSDHDADRVNDRDAGHLLAIAKAATATASELIRASSPRTLTTKGDRDVTSDVDVRRRRRRRDSRTRLFTQTYASRRILGRRRRWDQSR